MMNVNKKSFVNSLSLVFYVYLGLCKVNPKTIAQYNNDELKFYIILYIILYKILYQIPNILYKKKL